MQTTKCDDRQPADVIQFRRELYSGDAKIELSRPDKPREL
jgi:hypothetical protein